MGSQMRAIASEFPDGFEEDDELRSHFVRRLTLLQLAEQPASDAPPGSIPRTFVQYWDDLKAIPADVRECMDSWSDVGSKNVSMVQFDDESARAYIRSHFDLGELEAFERCQHPAMRSDYFRMCFLLAEGGLYVDADDVRNGSEWDDVFSTGDLKVQPLCYDIPTQSMVAPAEIRRANLATEGRIFYVNNNPIAAPPDHPVMRLALDRATTALLGVNPLPEIQSTTGPGNLTACLAAHAHELLLEGVRPDFHLLLDWDAVAATRWDLSYRNDERNWRNMRNQPNDNFRLA